ncbi:MAG TPA: deoxyhypusine synthase family protein, partial [Chloroflexota bacterium]|nr:deoxyhypusine synthase family protein [Chloroflexota bacterium]
MSNQNQPMIPRVHEHDEQYDRARAPYFRSPVHRLEPRAGTSQRELFETMHRAAGPLRNLAQVYLYWEEMLRAPRQAIWMTIAGAYVPFGLGGTLRTLIIQRFFDVLVTTPAQVTHDLTETRGHHHYHGTEEVDDNELQRLDVNRYWTVFGDEHQLNT